MKKMNWLSMEKILQNEKEQFIMFIRKYFNFKNLLIYKEKYKKRFSFAFMFEEKYKKFSVFKLCKFPSEI